MADSVALFCLVYGKPFARAFEVELGREKSVSALKKLIITEKANDFNGIDADHLDLWKVEIPVTDDDETLQKPELREGKLSPVKKIGELFSAKPPESHIHIIIKVHDTTGRKRRVGSPLNEDLASRIKRVKVVKTTPSTLAQPSTYEPMQLDQEQRILDDRPQEDCDIPPVPLLYDGFGQFLDIVAGATDVEGLDDVDAFQHHLAVEEFARSMCRFFGKEHERREEGLKLLNKIFSTRKDNLYPKLMAASIGPVATDGHYTGVHDVATGIGEFKNRPTGNSAIPEVELVGYFVRTFAREVQGHSEKLDGWRVPGLGISIVGCDVKFYAILSLNTQFRLVGLTPALSCIRSASEGRDREALHRAFMAASVLQARILKDKHHYQRFIGEIDNICLPNVSKLIRWPNAILASNDSLEFRIEKPFRNSPRKQLLYLAETKADGQAQTILVKFVRRYCPELHDICAASGHAPTLLAYQRLPGGWYGVAMEFAADAVPITLHKSISDHLERWKTDLQGLVAEFHNKGFIHGDLRETNIISGNDGHVMLIDFDWGGRDGVVSYPTPVLDPELVEGRFSKGLKITKADDLRILENTLAKTSAKIPCS